MSDKPKTLWLSRDACPMGGCMSRVDVWDERPERVLGYTTEGGVWLHAKSKNAAGRVEFLRLGECLDRFGVIPDNDNMLIRVGRDPGI